jgi:hypothetical protein
LSSAAFTDASIRLFSPAFDMARASAGRCRYYDIATAERVVPSITGARPNDARVTPGV